MGRVEDPPVPTRRVLREWEERMGEVYHVGAVAVLRTRRSTEDPLHDTLARPLRGYPSNPLSREEEFLVIRDSTSLDTRKLPGVKTFNNSACLRDAHEDLVEVII